MPGPSPLDPAAQQAIGASTGNILPGVGGGGQIAVDPAALSSLSGAMNNEANQIGPMATSAPMTPTGNPMLDGALSDFDSHLRNLVGTFAQVVAAVGGMVSTASVSYSNNDGNVGQSFGVHK